MIAITSSLIPLIAENSCLTPSIESDVIEAPGIDDRIIRRSELPRVCPYPGYNPSISYTPDVASSLTILGFDGKMIECEDICKLGS
jgi:hypothetical protein